ncbi:MAG: DNA-directed RNA polymerase subunit D [Desulfurococcales archaeon]|nr:DNA-directed RNA polymerase subunit D [Desulfurococcales archaeon]
MPGRRVEVLGADDRRITLLLEGYPIAFGNALRRLALSDVPTMAVDFAYFYDNNTGVHDEIIAHRLGLVVLKSDEALRKYRSPEECRGAHEGDRSCYVELILEDEVPEDADTGKYVKAGQLRSSDPDVTPVYPETPIVYLAPGQRVHIVAYARLGRGSEHGKWSPASISVLRYTPVIHYNSKAAGPECLECVEAYPEVRRLLESGGSGSVEMPHLKRTGGLLYCAEEACRGALEVEFDSSKLILEVESTGALRPERIVFEAARRLEERARRLLEELEKLGGEAE